MKRRRRRRKNRTPYHINSRRKGRESEEKVKAALRILKEEGFIKGFTQSAAFSPKDLAGIDFSICLPDFQKVEVQVKSSEEGAWRHTQRRPQIPVVVAKSNMTTRQVADRIKIIVRSYRRFAAQGAS